MLDLVETRERENKWWASGIILCVCVCAFVSAHFPVCVWALARVSDLFPGTPHQGLWDASQHKKESVFIRAQTHVLLDASRHLEWLPPPPFFSQWEILGGAKQLQTYKPKGPEIRQDVTSSWTLAIQRFTLFVSLLLPLSFGRKKKSLQQTSFYNLGESLTTAITHDKVFN